MKKLILTLTFTLLALPTLSFADTKTFNFEAPTFSTTTPSVNGQDGFLATGPFDQAIVENTYGFSQFSSQVLRISDAVTSGSFGDQVFAAPLTDAVGEANSTASTYSTGTLQNYFETQFDIASASSTTQQIGMHMSFSPDRGDGSRMSYLRFEDGTTGLDVFFDDVQGTTNPANFVETQIATGLNRTVPHTVKMTLQTVSGNSNDIVKIYIDSSLVHTGGSWEDYYRFDSEASAEQSARIVKTVLFRESGTANTADTGYGFLIDNLTLTSETTINGGWSDWSAQSTSCGITDNQTRSCTNPSPANGGSDCVGPTTQSYTTNSCPIPTPTPSVGGNGAPVGLIGQRTINITATTTPIITPVATSTATTTEPTIKFQFKKNLKLGMTDNDVLVLQQTLNKLGFTVAITGVGSTGNETNYFGKLTVKAIKKLQSAYKLPITGYFGPMTRKVINNL